LGFRARFGYGESRWAPTAHTSLRASRTFTHKTQEGSMRNGNRRARRNRNLPDFGELRRVEQLERRVLLSAIFTPAAPIAPTNRADLAANLTGWTPIEPFVRVNPNDPANVIPSSH